MSEEPTGPFGVTWAFVAGVDEWGNVFIMEHEDVHLVMARRAASLDDIHAATYVILDHERKFARYRPSSEPYVVAFLVFQLPDGHIAASPDIFDEVIPVSSPSDKQIVGAFGVLQGQIIATKAANMAAQVAVSATMSVLKQAVPVDPDAAKKTPGGLIRA